MTQSCRAPLVAALFAIALSPAAGAQSGLPPLPDGTPETVAGYDTASMYRKFTDWMSDKVRKSVEMRAWSMGTGGSLFLDTAYVKFDWDDDVLTFTSGNISLECDDPGSNSLFGPSRFTLTDQQAAELCAWNLHIVDSPGAADVAASWLGENFDTASAAAHLAGAGAAKGKINYQSIDWTGFRDASVLSRAPVIRVRSYSHRNCPAITDILARLETVQLGRIDIEYFGEDTEAAKGDWDEDIPFVHVSVQSRNAGKRMEVGFSGKSALPRSIYLDTLAITENCTQLP